MRMEPFLLITLHFSQIGFTDDLTFITTSISLPDMGPVSPAGQEKQFKYMFSQKPRRNSIASLIFKCKHYF